MIYQVNANLFFDSEDEAKDFYHDCELALPKAIVVNPGTPAQQCSECSLLNCFHDQDPHLQCLVVLHDDNCPDNT